MVFISIYSLMYLSLVLFNMITAIKVISVKIAPPKPTFWIPKLLTTMPPTAEPKEIPKLEKIEFSDDARTIDWG